VLCLISLALALKIIEGQHLNKHDLYHKNSPDDRNFYFSCKHIGQSRSFLKSTGISVALDDVGAGYAGLYQLVEINPDIAKLDMNLVRDVHNDRLKQSIVKALVQACKDAGIRVLAEGVEKREELEFFLELDVDFIQGFIFSKPDPYPKIRQIEELAYNSISSY